MKITENIHSLKIPFQIKVSPEMVLDRFVNVYIIFSEQVYLIDTGVTDGKELIYDYIKEQGRKPEEIGKVFITHAHPDHIGALKLIKEDSGCKVLSHKNKQKWVENADLQFKERPVPGFNELVSGSCIVDETFDDGDIFELGNNMTMEVIYTPGHSDDSVSLYFKEDKVLVTGDLVTLPGDLPIYTSYNELIKSLNKIKEIDFNVLLSSWAEPKSDNEAKDVIDKSISYLMNLDKIVEEVSNGNVPEDKMVFCGQIIEKLGLPKIAQNPLVAASFMSHINKG